MEKEWPLQDMLNVLRKCKDGVYASDMTDGEWAMASSFGAYPKITFITNGYVNPHYVLTENGKLLLEIMEKGLAEYIKQVTVAAYGVYCASSCGFLKDHKNVYAFCNRFCTRLTRSQHPTGFGQAVLRCGECNKCYVVDNAAKKWNDKNPGV